MTEAEVQIIANKTIRKYDWKTVQLPDAVKLIVTDGEKRASVIITTGEDILDEINRLIASVDAHEYVDLDG